MSEPSLIFQTAIRSALVADPAVTALVPPAQIRAGSTRPDNLPMIILATPQVLHMGRVSSEVFLSRVYLDLHVWALEDGADMARQIAVAVSVALWDAPGIIADLLEYERPSFRFARDPDPERAFCHAVANVSGMVEWSAP